VEFVETGPSPGFGTSPRSDRDQGAALHAVALTYLPIAVKTLSMVPFLLRDMPQKGETLCTISPTSCGFPGQVRGRRFGLFPSVLEAGVG